MTSSVNLTPKTQESIAEHRKKTPGFNFSKWVNEMWEKEFGLNSKIEDGFVLAARAWAEKEKQIELKAQYLSRVWLSKKDENYTIWYKINQEAQYKFPYPKLATQGMVWANEIEKAGWCIKEYEERSSPPTPTPPSEAVK